MKSLYRTIVCIIFVAANTNLCKSRTVLSESTREPIVYASVGVINRNLGTVTDTLGNFSLSILFFYSRLLLQLDGLLSINIDSVKTASFYVLYRRRLAEGFVDTFADGGCETLAEVAPSLLAAHER